jgi:uncharacterized membrane protein
MLAGVDRRTIVQIVAIMMAIGGVLGLCGGVAAVFGGTFLGFLSVGTSPLAGATGDPEAAAALAAGAGLGVIAVIAGILLLIEGILSLVVAVGLFTRQPWARMGTVVVCVIGVIAQVLSLATGGGFSAIIQGVIYAFVAYFFYTDAELRAYFERA